MSGSAESLARHLGCDTAQLARWLAGEQVIPPEVYLKLLDVVSRGSAPPPPRKRK